jgi:hypothetical protein
VSPVHFYKQVFAYGTQLRFILTKSSVNYLLRDTVNSPSYITYKYIIK